MPPFMNPNLLFTVLVLEAVALLPILSAHVLAPSRRERELKAALAQALTKNEELEKRVRELEDLNKGLQKQLKEREEFWKAKLEEEVAKAKEEAQRLSRVADTLLKALRDKILVLKDANNECASIVVLPDKVLCKRNGKVFTIWPEKSEAGEEVIES